MKYDGIVVVGTKLDTKDFEAEINYVENKLNDMIADYQTLSKEKGFNEQSNQAIELRKNIQKVSNQLNNLKEKQEKLGQGKFPKIKDIVEDINKSMSKSIARVGKWALGIFAIESAYGFVRRTMSTLSQYNEKIASDVEYINFALASMLQPVIETLINLVYKLLTYINYVAQQWFRINLFANASADAFNKANSNANKLKKTLSGFDEMNVLNENGTTGVLGGITNLSQLQGEIPEWMEWIAKNGVKITSTLIGIGSAIGLIKLSSLAKNLGLITNSLTALKALGIGIMIMGIINLLNELIIIYGKVDSSLENNGTKFEDWGKVITWIGVALAGLALIIASIPVAVASAIGLILGTMMKFWDEIKYGFDFLINWLYDKVNWLSSKGEFVLSTILVILSGVIDTIKELFNGLFISIKNLLDGILLLFKGDFKNGFANIGKGIANVFITALNTVITAINTIWKGLLNIVDAVGSIFGKQWDLKTKLSISKIPYLKTGGIVNMPSRGVPIGGAIAGESGAEGVIPLTDTQAMETLGATIGKYITINANITNTMNGRVISRELQKINTNNDFATNR